MCDNCGLVAEEMVIDSYPQIVDEKIEREPGSDKILPQIVFGPRDSRGGPVNPSKVWGLKRTAGMFNLKAADRQRLKITRQITQICSTNQLSRDVADRAIFVYRKVVEGKVIDKPSMKELSLAVIVIACRERHIFLDVQEFSEINEAEKKSVLRYYHRICGDLKVTPVLPDAENYIIKFVNCMKLDANTSRALVQDAIRVLKESNVEAINPNPKPVAAAAVYVALTGSSRNVTQKAIKDITGISEVTIRKWVEKLSSRLETTRQNDPLIEPIDPSKIED